MRSALWSLGVGGWGGRGAENRCQKQLPRDCCWDRRSGPVSVRQRKDYLPAAAGLSITGVLRTFCRASSRSKNCSTGLQDGAYLGPLPKGNQDISG